MEFILLLPTTIVAVATDSDIHHLNGGGGDIFWHEKKDGTMELIVGYLEMQTLTQSTINQAFLLHLTLNSGDW